MPLDYAANHINLIALRRHRSPLVIPPAVNRKGTSWASE